jgi:prefoldin subunit 5
MTWEQIERAMEFLTAQAAKHDTQIEQLIQAVGQDAENIRALARIAEAHQRRLDDLEG